MESYILEWKDNNIYDEYLEINEADRGWELLVE